MSTNSQLRELSDGAYAWVAPNGSWGWSNAGLIVDGDQSLLVDTLYDLSLTGDMLKVMHDVEPCTRRIDTLVNTHANGDHCHGNELVTGADIIASEATALEMNELPPEAMAALMATAGEMGHVGEYFLHCFGQFTFDGITYTPPNKTFKGELDLTVGDKPVHLIEVGPAHTRGDVLVHSPTDSAVFTGDILFIDCTPIVWEGPISNWVAACRRIEAMDVTHIVPGHGPITDRRGVERVRNYLEFVQREAKLRFDAGMGVEQAAQDIDLGEFGDWGESERIVVNVDTAYREFAADAERTDIFELFRQMAEIAGYRPASQ
jgi:glyoxylase-like metal-dependent hydrolase (beta-lactamase superfamily II)